MTRRTSLTVLSAATAALLSASLPSPGAIAEPTTGPADPATVDRSDLPLQTRVLGGVWDQVRPLIDQDGVADDPAFYTVPDTMTDAELQSLAPGTVLRERTLQYNMVGIEVPLTVTQILYATTNARGEIEPNVTSVIAPPGKSDGNVLAYQSFYDSSNPVDNPSRTIAGNVALGGLLVSVETLLFAPALLAGHPVILADTEGADANFAAGPVYGRATLDSIRAAEQAASSPVTDSDRIGLLGYSGGAIASSWAVALMPEYAPEFVTRTVGVAEGGVFVNPGSNLAYAGDGLLWSGVVGLALSSLAQTYDIDTGTYFTEYGQTVMADMSSLSIVEAAARYPGLHWSDLARPEYPTPESAPEVKAVIDAINLGNAATPQTPMFIGQGTGGTLELTPEHETLGAGDAVMIAGDVRSLARQYCADGASVEYRQYEGLSHVLSVLPWLPEAYAWIEGRFAGAPVTDNCSTIAPGNQL